MNYSVHSTVFAIALSLVWSTQSLQGNYIPIQQASGGLVTSNHYSPPQGGAEVTDSRQSESDLYTGTDAMRMTESYRSPLSSSFSAFDSTLQGSSAFKLSPNGLGQVDVKANFSKHLFEKLSEKPAVQQQVSLPPALQQALKKPTVDQDVEALPESGTQHKADSGLTIQQRGRLGGDQRSVDKEFTIRFGDRSGALGQIERDIEPEHALIQSAKLKEAWEEKSERAMILDWQNTIELGEYEHSDQMLITTLRRQQAVDGKNSETLSIPKSECWDGYLEGHEEATSKNEFSAFIVLPQGVRGSSGGPRLGIPVQGELADAKPLAQNSDLKLAFGRESGLEALWWVAPVLLVSFAVWCTWCAIGSNKREVNELLTEFIFFEPESEIRPCKISSSFKPAAPNYRLAGTHSSSAETIANGEQQQQEVDLDAAEDSRLLSELLAVNGELEPVGAAPEMRQTASTLS